MNKKHSNRLLTVLLVIFLFFVTLSLIFLFVILSRGSGNTAVSHSLEQVSSVLDTSAPKLDENQQTREEAEAKDRERAAAEEEPGVVISGRPQFFAEAGKDIIEGINLENSEENAGLYYISYEMRLLDDSPEDYEILFSTDMIGPGNVISDVKLTRALEAGEYECILHAQPYYMDTLALTNNADMKVLLSVK